MQSSFRINFSYPQPLETNLDEGDNTECGIQIVHEQRETERTLAPRFLAMLEELSGI